MYTDCEERKGLYRSRRSVLFGVCRGTAEYLGVSVGATRILTLLALIFTGFFPVGLGYLVMACVLHKEPRCAPRYVYIDSDYDEMRSSRLRRNFDGLDARIQNIESIVTRRGYDFDERLNRA